MSDRKRAKHRRQQKAARRVDRWELEFASARGTDERLNIAYRWCLAEMRRQKAGSFFNRIDAERFEPAIQALIRAARNSDAT